MAELSTFIENWKLIRSEHCLIRLPRKCDNEEPLCEAATNEIFGAPKKSNKKIMGAQSVYSWVTHPKTEIDSKLS